MDKHAIAQLIVKEIHDQGNQTYDLGDGETIILMAGPNQLNTINLVQLSEKIIEKMDPRQSRETRRNAVTKALAEVAIQMEGASAVRQVYGNQLVITFDGKEQYTVIVCRKRVQEDGHDRQRRQ